MASSIKQPKLLNYKNLNIEKYEYLLPHKTQNGYYQSICNYRLNKNQMLPFYFETPKLKTTSGIVKIDNKFYMDFELSQSGDIGLLHDFITKTDDNNISVCHENSREWFNQVMPLNVVETYYKTPIIKKPNGQLPIFRVRLPSYKGNILTEIFNVRKEKVQDINCIQEGDYLIGIIEFSGLMFMSQNFTPCYELHKIKLFKDNDARLLTSGYIFSDMHEPVDLVSNNTIKTDNILEDPIVNIESIDKSIDKSIVQNDNLLKSATKVSSNALDSLLKPIDCLAPLIDTKMIDIIKPKPVQKSLFEMIKETTLKDFLIDETLFNNNNKLFNNKQNNNNKNTNTINDVKQIIVPEQKIDLVVKIVKEQEKTSEIVIPVVENAELKIQDIDNIDLDIDYNLESPRSSQSPSDPEEDPEEESDNKSYYDELNNNSDIINILENYDKSQQKLENPVEENESDEEDEEDEEDDENEEEDNNKDENDNEEDDEENQENAEGEKDDEHDEEDEDDSDNEIDYDTLNDLEVMVFDE